MGRQLYENSNRASGGLHSAICSLNLLERFIESTNGKWGKRGRRAEICFCSLEGEEGKKVRQDSSSYSSSSSKKIIGREFSYSLPFLVAATSISFNLNNFFISFDFSTN